jgi:hypothetical protein
MVPVQRTKTAARILFPVGPDGSPLPTKHHVLIELHAALPGA